MKKFELVSARKKIYFLFQNIQFLFLLLWLSQRTYMYQVLMIASAQLQENANYSFAAVLPLMIQKISGILSEYYHTT